jgi:hypothetical protein
LLLVQGQDKLLEFLKDETGRSLSALKHALDEVSLLDEHKFLIVCAHDKKLLERIRPFVSLIRDDSFGRPLVTLTDSIYVTTASIDNLNGTQVVAATEDRLPLPRGSAKPTAQIVEPYGVLIGIRRDLVAKPKADTGGPLRYYVAERIESAELTGESFVRDPDFEIDKHAQKAFGAFQNDMEYHGCPV